MFITKSTQQGQPIALSQSPLKVLDKEERIERIWIGRIPLNHLTRLVMFQPAPGTVEENLPIPSPGANLWGFLMPPTHTLLQIIR